MTDAPPPLPDWLLRGDATNTYVHTRPLTKFELCMVIGTRAMELAQTAEPRVAVPERMLDDPLAIARLELESRRLPPTALLRYLPNGGMERKAVEDLFVPVRN